MRLQHQRLGYNIKRSTLHVGQNVCTELSRTLVRLSPLIKLSHRTIANSKEADLERTPMLPLIADRIAHAF